MKITLLKNVGDVGVITEWKKLLPDRLKIDVGEDGALTIGSKTKRTANGSVSFYEFELTLGSQRVEFKTDDGRVFQCGVIARNGRFIQVTNELDELVTRLALAYERQEREIESLRAEISKKEKERSIKIV